MKRSQTKFKFIHCKTLHCIFSGRVRILDYLSAYLSASDPSRDKKMAETEENFETKGSRVATMLTVRGAGAGASLRQDHFV